MPQNDQMKGFRLSPGRDADVSRRGRSILFAIGISRYAHFRSLSNAVRDVDYLVEVLTHRYQFDGKWVIRLSDEEATLGNISRHFHQLIELAEPDDEVFIYFSGHGDYNALIDRGYWIPYDGQPGETHTQLSNSTLVDFIGSIRARHVVLAVDSCFSGSFFGGVRKGEVLERLESIPSRWVLTSGRNEPVSDGVPGRNSPFAESLIFHLNENAKTDLRISELYPRIVEQVGANSEQLPRCEPIRNVGHKGGEFAFHLKKDLSAPLALPNAYQPSAPARVVPAPPRQGWKIAAAVAATLIAVAAIIGAIRLGEKEPKPAVSWKKDLYQSITPSGAGGFIVGRNDSFGYADRDTNLLSGLVYQEAYRFQDGLARVKKDGRYGWIDSLGQVAISLAYDAAEDFAGDRAAVIRNGEQFFIDHQGRRIHEETTAGPDDISKPAPASQQDQPATPQPARLSVRPSPDNTDRVPAGETADFYLVVTNSGESGARNIRVTMSGPLTLVSDNGFDLAAGRTRTLHFRLATRPDDRGSVGGSITLRGDNLPQSATVQASVTVIAPPSLPPAPATMTVACPLGRPGCQIQFFDPVQDKPVAFTTDANGTGRYTIARDLKGKTVEVTFTCGGHTDRQTVRVSAVDGCIALPQ